MVLARFFSWSLALTLLIIACALHLANAAGNKLAKRLHCIVDADCVDLCF